MKNIISKKGNGFERFGSKDEMTIKNDKSKYIKYIEVQNRISKMYNQNDELIGVDLHDNCDKNFKEVIYNSNTGTTIVILHDECGKWKAKSVCNKNIDIYNPQVGYDIAYYRALKKICDAKIKELTK